MTLPDWFAGAGLGLFVTWDHSSQRGMEISWPLVGLSIIPGHTEPEDVVTAEEYHAGAATFNPQRWDAPGLARLAREAGARYVVFTARHHSGYSMFHTDHSDFGIRQSPYGRDICGEFADAVRAEGLKVGIYYSLPDWHHPDYPAFRDEDRPYRVNRYPRPAAGQWSRYLEYVRGQLTELLTNYGAIDLLWFDGEWERTADEWDAAALRQHIKSLAPDVIINDRLPGQGDYYTSEQGLPADAPSGPWELCLTMNDTWGWRPADTAYKSALHLAEHLSIAVSRGGNLLLNISPQGDGSLPGQQVELLRVLGAWIASHGEALTGARPASRAIDYYGPATQRGNRVYLHLLNRPVERVSVRGLPVERISGVRLLGSGRALTYRTSFNLRQQAEPGKGPVGELTITAPASTPALIDIIAVDLDPESLQT